MKAEHTNSRENTNFITQNSAPYTLSSSTTTNKTLFTAGDDNLMWISTKINHQPCTALLDSGAQGNFLSSQFAEKLHWNLTKSKPVKVRLPDGTIITSDQEVRNVPVEVGNTKIVQKTSFRILPMQISVILGITWLKEVNPFINWTRGEMVFDTKRGKIRVLSSSSKPRTGLNQVTLDTESDFPEIKSELKNLLQQYHDRFPV